MKPYYERDGIVIYHGDCREVLPLVDADVCITDPPYGVGFEYTDSPFTDSESEWPTVLGILSGVSKAVPSSICMSFRRMWEMPPARWAACWWKPGSVRRSRAGGWSTWEPVLLYGDGWRIANDLIRLPDCVNHSRDGGGGHPCPKPVQLFRWIINGSPKGTILDPFMGSGTTLVAAKLEGRKAIGIEISEAYCEIAANRLAQGVLF